MAFNRLKREPAIETVCHQYIKHSGEQLHCKKQLHHKKVVAGEIPIETIAPLSAAVTPLLQTAVDCYRLLQTATDCFRLLQTAVLCHQPFGYSSSVKRSILQNVVFDMSPCNTHSMQWFNRSQSPVNCSAQYAVFHSALFFSVFPLCNVSQ